MSNWLSEQDILILLQILTEKSVLSLKNANSDLIMRADFSWEAELSPHQRENTEGISLGSKGGGLSASPLFEGQ